MRGLGDAELWKSWSMKRSLGSLYALIVDWPVFGSAAL